MKQCGAAQSCHHARAPFTQISPSHPPLSQPPPPYRKGKTYDILSILLIRENGNNDGKEYSEKVAPSKKHKKRNKNKKGCKQLLGNCVWLSGLLHIEERLNDGLRLHSESKKTRTKQNRTHVNTRERRHAICKPNARKIQVRTICGYSTMARKSVRARLLWAILSFVLPVTFRHSTACRSPALTFSAAIYFTLKLSAPCSAVLRHSLSSWVAVVHWSVPMAKAPRSSRKHPIHYFSWPPTQPAPPPILRTSRTLAVSYLPCAPQISRTRSNFCVRP